jgi:hypothetical protein
LRQRVGRFDSPGELSGDPSDLGDPWPGIGQALNVVFATGVKELQERSREDDEGDDDFEEGTSKPSLSKPKKNDEVATFVAKSKVMSKPKGTKRKREKKVADEPDDVVDFTAESSDSFGFDANEAGKAGVDSCMVCNKNNDEDKQLLCDGCGKYYHMACVFPPLTAVPSEDKWYCTNCQVDEEERKTKLLLGEEKKNEKLMALKARNAQMGRKLHESHEAGMDSRSDMAKMAGIDIKKFLGRKEVKEIVEEPSAAGKLFRNPIFSNDDFDSYGLQPSR